jgi:hypothetical protein
MTTQTKVSGPVETTQGQIVKSYFTQILAAMAILIVGFFGGVFATPLIGVREQPATANEVSPQRSIEAESARYSGLAGFYMAEKSDGQRAIEAEATRYSGLATLYAEENQRAFEAEAARYSGLATLYTSVEEKSASADFLADNPELMVAQRYTAIAENEGISGPSLLDADPARLLTHRSAEIRQIMQTFLLAANPELSIVHRYAAKVE